MYLHQNKAQKYKEIIETTGIHPLSKLKKLKNIYKRFSTADEKQAFKIKNNKLSGQSSFISNDSLDMTN